MDKIPIALEVVTKFIPASNEPSGCLQTFGDCREGQIPRPLGRFKFDAPLLAAGFLTNANENEELIRLKEMLNLAITYKTIVGFDF